MNRRAGRPRAPRSRWFGILLSAIVGLFADASTAPAVSTGITGNSGKQGSTCEDCHDEGVVPVVRFQGPHQVLAGAMATFRFVVESQSSRQPFSGFNVAASSGDLETVPGQGEQLMVGELTHDMPKPDTELVAFFEFLWLAPDQPGAQTLYGAGVAANGHGSRAGDGSAATTLAVTVTRDRGDANCDGSVSAADLPALLTLLPAGTANACALADCDCNGGISEADLPIAVAAMFAPAGQSGCGQ